MLSEIVAAHSLPAGLEQSMRMYCLVTKLKCCTMESGGDV
jgi:hypothetical protein